MNKRQTELPQTDSLEATRKKRGRPPGKHSDPNYKQFSVWLKHDTQRSVKARLALEAGEFSELIQNLLEGWLRKEQS